VAESHGTDVWLWSVVQGYLCVRKNVPFVCEKNVPFCEKKQLPAGGVPLSASDMCCVCPAGGAVGMAVPGAMCSLIPLTFFSSADRIMAGTAGEQAGPGARLSLRVML